MVVVGVCAGARVADWGARREALPLFLGWAKRSETATVIWR